MTAETRTTVTLSDFKAMEFECSRCHARVIVPLSDDAFVPSGCPAPGCENQNWYVLGSPEHRDLRALVDLIRRYGKAQSPSYGVRFEVKMCPPPVLPG